MSANKYTPQVNMPERVAAAYWEGALTRAEAQKVFDEYGQRLIQQAEACVRLDMCLAYLCEKFGITPDDVQKWAESKAENAKVGQEATGQIVCSA